MKKLFTLCIILFASHLHAQSTPLTSVACPASEVTGWTSDGPAKLPITCVHIPEVSSTGTQVATTATGLQQAITAAKCGDTLVIPAMTYTFSNFVGKSCTAGKFITYRPVAMATAIPPSGTRIDTSTAKVPRIIVVGTFSPGNYSHYVGIEITVIQSFTGFNSGLVDARNTDHVIFDRTYVHGAPGAEVQRGFNVSGAKYFAVINSNLSEFHCTTTCSDAQGILGGLGNGGGPLLISNNFIEASGENILFGGGAAETCDTANVCKALPTQCDITIWRNDFFKPLYWMPNDPTFTGVRWHVKNSLELKNACRVLIDQNLFTNAWGGFSQEGYGVLFTDKNQGGKAPGAIVSDVTIRNFIINAGGCFQIAAATDDAITTSITMPDGSVVKTVVRPSGLGIKNISIHDGLCSADSNKYYSSAGIGMQITLQDPLAVFNEIVIDRLTINSAQNSAFMFGAREAGFLQITHSIFAPGKYGSTGTGSGPTDCSQGLNTKPAQAITACWTNSSFANDFILGGTQVWPTGFQVVPTAPAGSGVDQVALQNLLKGVQ